MCGRKKRRKKGLSGGEGTFCGLRAQTTLHRLPGMWWPGPPALLLKSGFRDQPKDGEVRASFVQHNLYIVKRNKKEMFQGQRKAREFALYPEPGAGGVGEFTCCRGRRQFSHQLFPENLILPKPRHSQCGKQKRSGNSHKLLPRGKSGCLPVLFSLMEC